MPKHEFYRTKLGGYITKVNGKVVLYQPPINTKQPFAPHHINANNGNIGYRQVTHGSNRYWRVVRNKNNGKWKVNESTKRTYFISTPRGFKPEHEVYGHYRFSTSPRRNTK